FYRTRSRPASTLFPYTTLFRSDFGRRDFLGLLLSGLAGRASGLASPVFGLPSQVPLFREVAEEVGLKFHHFTGATGEYYMPEIRSEEHTSELQSPDHLVCRLLL